MRCFILAVLFVLLATPAGAEIYVLAWDAPHSGATGFKLYAGEKPRLLNAYTQIADVGMPATNPDGTRYIQSFDTLPTGCEQQVYIAVTAYNSAGESPYSDEVLAPMRGDAPVIAYVTSADNLATVTGTRFSSNAILRINGVVATSATRINCETLTVPYAIFNDPAIDTWELQVCVPDKKPPAQPSDPVPEVCSVAYPLTPSAPTGLSILP